MNMKKFSRREFLKSASICVAAGCAGLNALPAFAAMRGGGGGGCGCGGGGSIIDPPVGGLFRDPPVLANLSQEPGIVEVTLEAMRAQASVNGVTANLLTYNGLFPGGTIRARSSDLLRIRFRNGLPNNGLLNSWAIPCMLQTCTPMVCT